jgi:hypothetical protein
VDSRVDVAMAIHNTYTLKSNGIYWVPHHTNCCSSTAVAENDNLSRYDLLATLTVSFPAPNYD